MYSNLILKEKTDSRVVYLYSIDREDVPVDGEIEFDRKTETSKILKPATGDNDGWRGRRVFGFLRKLILEKNCPEKSIWAIG